MDSALIRTWRDAGVLRDVIDRIAPLVGRRFVGQHWRAVLDSAFGAPGESGQGMQRLAEATRIRGVPMRRIVTGPALGYYANGSLGQWLLVLPEERLVVVRQIRRRADHSHRDTFSELPAVVRSLLGRQDSK